MRHYALRLLSFGDTRLERDYLQRYWDHWLPYARVGMLSAAFLGGAFSLLDHLVADYAIKPLSIIRFGVLVPTILIGFFLSFVEFLSSRYHVVIMCCLIIVGVCIVAMISIIEPPASDHYYAGLILVLFFNYTLLQLRLPHAFLAGITLVVLYEILALFFLDSPYDTLINNTFFIVATSYGGVFACYTIERSRRDNFEQLRIIEHEREKMERMAKRLEEVSCRDELTGLLNRRRLSSSLRTAIERFGRLRECSALMMVDVDDFKGINDTLGHHKGDDVLIGVAHAIRTSLNDGCAAFRIGGDEFLIILPGVTATGSLPVARRIQKLVETTQLSPSLDPRRRVTVSIGITEVTTSSTSVRSLMKTADSALYEAKLGGKGRIATRAGLEPDTQGGQCR